VHEFSVISSIVDLVKDEMSKHDKLNFVKEIVLEVGELSFLSHDALQFGFRALVENEEKIKDDALTIVPIPAKVKCTQCDYEGAMKVDETEEYHISIPRFTCPECNGRIDVLQGKECVVRNLVLDLEDG
jgi:hydrogenase nickel incorporation protein HypA/HybF